MDYKMTIAGLERHLPLCKVTDDLYIAGFIMFNDVEITKAVAAELLAKAPEFDVLITAESKGIPLRYEMARQSAKPYIVARKGAKLYMQDIAKVEVRSITTDHIQTLCLGKDERDVMEGKKILIVDDVISTGDSIKALEQLVETVGGNIVGKFTVLAEGEAADRDDIVYLEYLPLFNPDGTPIKAHEDRETHPTMSKSE
ncbi:MAG: adenine phosphoribosyltransferase [Mogibacterium sp.]|nr:adenine phosphoribosyltransferase [Mogibacterium sp.]